MNAPYEIDETGFFSSRPDNRRKLSEKDVNAIRKMGWTQTETAKLYRVAQSTISRSLRRTK